MARSPFKVYLLPSAAVAYISSLWALGRSVANSRLWNWPVTSATGLNVRFYTGLIGVENIQTVVCTRLLGEINEGSKLVFIAQNN